MDQKESLIQSLIEEGYLKTPEIIEAMRAIDRRDFVPEEMLDYAYANYPLSIGEGQTISQPLTVAFLLELLELKSGEKILDVGAGSGWTTALLAHLVGEKGEVIGVERIPGLCEFGKNNLAKYFAGPRAKIICSDGTMGFPAEAPFNKILASAAASRKIPQTWRDQLKVGGRIAAPVEGSIWLFEKKQVTINKRQVIEWEEREFPGFAFVPLIKDH